MSAKALGLALLCGSVASCNDRQVLESFPESFVGVGLELTDQAGQLTVVRALQGGPAELGGVRGGDEITAIDGQVTLGMTLGDAVGMMRGKPNSQLTLSLRRGEERLIVVLRRQAMSKAGSADYASQAQKPNPSQGLEPEQKPEPKPEPAPAPKSKKSKSRKK